MKLLMALVDESCKEELEVLLTRAGVSGFTEIQRAAGMGTSGPRLGSAAFPKTSAIVLTFVEDADVARVAAAVRAAARRRAASTSSPGASSRSSPDPEESHADVRVRLQGLRAAVRGDPEPRPGPARAGLS